jgi:hypothetical protein
MTTWLRTLAEAQEIRMWEMTDQEIAQAILLMKRRSVPYQNDRLGGNVARAVYYRWATSLLISIFFPVKGDTQSYWKPIGLVVGLSSNRLKHYVVQLDIKAGPLVCNAVYGKCSLMFGHNIVVSAIKDALGKHFTQVPNFDSVEDFTKFLSGLGYVVAVGIQPDPTGWTAYSLKESRRANQAQSAAFGQAAGVPSTNPMGIPVRAATHSNADAEASAKAFETQ